MNKLILLLCFLLPMSAFGQGKKSKRAIYFLELQGGLLFDAHQRADYLGPNQLHIGWSKVKNNRINEIALEFVRYTTDFQPEPGPNTTPPKWRRKRQSIEAKYFLSVWSKGGEKYRFYAGPISSFLIMKNNFDPSSPSRVKSEEKCYCLGVGAKGQLYYQLTRNIYLNVSTRLILLDAGYSEKQEFSPWVPLSRQLTKEFTVDLLRNQFPLLVGFSFKL